MNKGEKGLIQKCKNGDKDAFRILINKYKTDAVNVAYQMISDRQLAEDIAQEAFIRVYKNIKNFKEDSSFFTWLYKIILNLCRDYFRQQPDEDLLSLEEPPLRNVLRRQVPDEEDAPERYLEKKELQRVIMEGLDTLSFKHRQVIILRDMQGFTYQEIADFLEIPLGTVKSRLNTARSRLQKYLTNSKKKQIN